MKKDFSLKKKEKERETWKSEKLSFVMFGAWLLILTPNENKEITTKKKIPDTLTLPFHKLSLNMRCCSVILVNLDTSSILLWMMSFLRHLPNTVCSCSAKPTFPHCLACAPFQPLAWDSWLASQQDLLGTKSSNLKRIEEKKNKQKTLIPCSHILAQVGAIDFPHGQ